MAATKKTHTGDGATVLYPVNFTNGFISRDDVYVYLDGDVYTNQIAYTWVNDTQIQITVPVADTQVFYIQRIVQRDDAVNDYTDGAILKEKNLDDSYNQALMIIEEIDDGFVLGPNESIQSLITAESGGRYVQEAVPTGDDITDGVVWYKPSDATTYVYYEDDDSAQWVEEHPATGGTEVQDVLLITDSVASPATILATAQLYVDTLDGSLKVKFGGGTVKVLATNP